MEITQPPGQSLSVTDCGLNSEYFNYKRVLKLVMSKFLNYTVWRFLITISSALHFMKYTVICVQTYMVQIALLFATQNPGVQVGGQAMKINKNEWFV